ncbi:hypothetical protein CEUSTIGMA_g12327.t1 [Chlamydomonas eustigma]|uniref:Armadillo repeat-containing domain-containing protein n=1 Tax=Chlamydomonas eustigma TaxID=1157962 RepID=A0A250XPD3_9CHLO|nr:hypothetical protein CEUSTIGMA_g12327.t1 [Chlamydomonas eustigma]|eukprot:GAX84906.1 hypothetical protein CEUSTIGMA_g12327.t1 [Chlamydomonas eustigma]
MAVEKTAKDISLICTKDKRILEEDRRSELLDLLRAFVQPNENPNLSSNFNIPGADPVHVFIEILLQRSVQKDAEAVHLLLRSLKILSRKQDNRCIIGADGIMAVLLSLSPPLTPKIAAEGANVLLNVCYEPQNVSALLNTTGVQQLVGFLSDDDPDLQANAAGAIQSICFQPLGRQRVCDLGGIQNLLPLLGCNHPKVVTRAAGAIHNLSSDSESIRLIRKYAGIPRLLLLLSDTNVAVAGSAAGALQNVSRELASRLLIREMDAIPALAMLLSCEDVHAQVCAAGALLNILGPDLEGGMYGPRADRRSLGRMMSLVMAASMVFDGVYEKRPEIV